MDSGGGGAKSSDGGFVSFVGGGGDWGDQYSWLTGVIFGALTFSTLTAVQQSAGDTRFVALAVAAYADYALLYWFLRRASRSPEGSPGRQRLKAAVWILSTLLIVFTLLMLPETLPPAVAIGLRLIGGAVAVAGFWRLCVYRCRPAAAGLHQEILAGKAAPAP